MTALGSFATARRGGVSLTDVEDAREKLGSRATPAQIAKMLGRCEADVKAVLTPATEIKPVAAEAEESGRFRWTPEAETLADLMREMGKSSGQIAAALRCDGSTVRLRWKTNGEAA